MSRSNRRKVRWSNPPWHVTRSSNVVRLLLAMRLVKAIEDSDAGLSYSDYSSYRGSNFGGDDLLDSLYYAEDEYEERILQALERSGYFDSEIDEIQQHDEVSACADDGERSNDEAISAVDERKQGVNIIRKVHRSRAFSGATPPKDSQPCTLIKKSQQSQDAASRRRNIEWRYIPFPPTYRAKTPILNDPRSRYAATSTSTWADLQRGDRNSPTKLWEQQEMNTLPSPSRLEFAGDRQQQQKAALEAITTPWVRRFLSGCHRDVLLPVPKDYCAGNFNLVQLPSIIKGISASLKIIDPSSAATKSYPTYRQAFKLLTLDEPLPVDIPEHIELATAALYLLLHQRYIVSPRGMDMVRRRFLIKSSSSSSLTGPSETKVGTDNPGDVGDVDPIFGRCPTLECRGMPLLPIGDSDSYSCLAMTLSSNPATRIREPAVLAANHRAQRYCASCNEVFYHWDSKVDGCAWGTSFCHLFLMVYGKEVFGDRSWQPHRRRQHDRSHVEQIFGFKLHPSALR